MRKEARRKDEKDKRRSENTKSQEGKLRQIFSSVISTD